jgi:hypothetical protein
LAVVTDVYFLTLHVPYDEPGAPGPVNALVVHAATLLHPALPQPDAGRIYRCLTEAPGRTPGCLVPLSVLTWELDCGSLWDQVGDWPAVTAALAELSRAGDLFDSKPLVLNEVSCGLLSTPPGQDIHVITEEGVTVVGDHHRASLHAALTATLPEATGDTPLWPGDGLIPPPEDPLVMPYRPCRCGR